MKDGTLPGAGDTAGSVTESAAPYCTTAGPPNLTIGGALVTSLADLFLLKNTCHNYFPHVKNVHTILYTWTSYKINPRRTVPLRALRASL